MLERERASQPFRLRLLRRSRPMPVRVDGERDRRVPELPLHPYDLGAAFEREPRERVPERVEVALSAALADARDSGPLERRVQHALGDVPGRQVAALFTLEHEIAGVSAGDLEPLL